jgi:hypothetical protein
MRIWIGDPALTTGSARTMARCAAGSGGPSYARSVAQPAQSVATTRVAQKGV